ncbi:hypothetical protein Tco_0090132 [Tanacetum coccineum]
MLANMKMELGLTEKGLPKKATTLNVLDIRGGKIQKEKNKPQGDKGKDKGKTKLVYSLKPKIPPPPKRDNMAKDSICHQCKEVGIFTIELYAFSNKSWVYDMGCGTHICNTSQGLRKSINLKHGALSLYVSNGMRVAVKAIGSFDLILPSDLVIMLDNCHFAPTITRVPRDGIYEIDLHGFYSNGYALEFVARILNMVPTKKVKRMPYETGHGKAPKLSYLRVWGCEALLKRDTPDKLDSRSIKCIFVGYPKEMMGYYFYYLLENKIFVSRNA